MSDCVDQHRWSDQQNATNPTSGRIPEVVGPRTTTTPTSADQRRDSRQAHTTVGPQESVTSAFSWCSTSPAAASSTPRRTACSKASKSCPDAPGPTSSAIPVAILRLIPAANASAGPPFFPPRRGAAAERRGADARRPAGLHSVHRWPRSTLSTTPGSADTPRSAPGLPRPLPPESAASPSCRPVARQRQDRAASRGPPVGATTGCLAAAAAPLRQRPRTHRPITPCATPPQRHSPHKSDVHPSQRLAAGTPTCCRQGSEVRLDCRHPRQRAVDSLAGEVVVDVTVGLSPGQRRADALSGDRNASVYGRFWVFGGTGGKG